MSTNQSPTELRRELQLLLSEERELVDRASSAMSSGDYARLRDFADELMKVVERRALIRVALVEARAREAADQVHGTSPRATSDQTEDTWRRLR